MTFKFNSDNLKKVEQILAKYPSERKKSAVMPLLDLAQRQNDNWVSKDVIAEIIMKYLPDWRRVLNELQRYSVSGSIDVGILSSISELEIKNLMIAMRNKDFVSVRRWAALNAEGSPQEVYRKIYDTLTDFLENQSTCTGKRNA